MKTISRPDDRRENGNCDLGKEVPANCSCETDFEKMSALVRLAASLAPELESVAQLLDVEASALQSMPEQSRIVTIAQLLQHKSRRLQSMTEDLQRFAGIPPAILQPFAPAHVIAELEPVLKELTPSWVTLSVSCKDARSLVYGNIVEFEQIIIGLFSHARGRMSAGGCLVISCLDTTTHVGGILSPRMTLTVSDNGPAVSTKELQRLFEPIFKRRTYGIGIGLASVYGVVGRMGGEIAVDSDSFGLRFTIVLPTQSRDHGPVFRRDPSASLKLAASPCEPAQAKRPARTL